MLFRSSCFLPAASVRKDVQTFVQRYGNQVESTRQVARILHGISSPKVGICSRKLGLMRLVPFVGLESSAVLGSCQAGAVWRGIEIGSRGLAFEQRLN